MDVRGGGQEADQERIIKDNGYGSDNEVDSRNDAAWNGTRPLSAQPSVKPPVNRSIAAMQAPTPDDDSSEAAQPSGTVMDTADEPRNTGGQIAPVGGILGASLLIFLPWLPAIAADSSMDSSSERNYPFP